MHSNEWRAIEEAAREDEPRRQGQRAAEEREAAAQRVEGIVCPAGGA